MTVTKQQFKNNLNGYIGVVVIGPKGDDRGIPVEPGGTVWLTEAEQTLTANAPRDAADNPFVPQIWPVFNTDTGQMEDQTITPLTAVDEGRFVPASMRYVPGVEGEGARGLAAAQAAATGADPVSVSTLEAGVLQREAEVAAAGPDVRPQEPPPVPRAAQMAAAAAEEARQAEAQWQIDAQDAAQGLVAAEEARSEPVVPEPAPEPPAPLMDDPATPTFNEATQTFVDPSTPAPAEEVAVQVDPAIGEETGAAPPPQGDAVAGTFAPGEEVGTPDAPSQPPPFTPTEG